MVTHWTMKIVPVWFQNLHGYILLNGSVLSEISSCIHHSRELHLDYRHHGSFTKLWSQGVLLAMLYNVSFRHDVHVPRMVETKLAIVMDVPATFVDHPGWSAAVYFWMFPQWLILSCLVTSNGVVFVFGLTQSIATSCHKNESHSTLS